MSIGNQGNEHPHLRYNDIMAQLSLDEIQGKLSELMKKQSFAQRMYNQPMINQLNMIIATYSRAYNTKLEEAFGDDDNNLDEQIDIS